jgi:outer membrane lipopolysaccharide assembly protein LptE/RlpB
MTFRHFIQAALILLGTAVALAGAACGYRFSGEGEFPYGVKKIAVEVFKNRSAEVGLENTVASNLIYEMTRSGQVTVTEGEEADAVIRGTIQQVADRSVSRSELLTAEERRVFIRVDVQLSRTGGKTLWSAEGLQEDEAFTVSEDRSFTDANRRKALDQLTRRLAEKIYQRITTNF